MTTPNVSKPYTDADGNDLTQDEAQRVIEAAGYTIQSNGLDKIGKGWWALLPGQTEFIDTTDLHEANPNEPLIQSYLGFFSSKEDLILEVFETIVEETVFSRITSRDQARSSTPN